VGRELSDSVREDFPVLRTRRNGKPPIYLDNACTTLVPRQVVEAITEYYTRYPGCGSGRSRYWFSEEVTSRIEGDPDRGVKGSRQIVQEFINARSEKEIVFMLNASHAINTVALGYEFQSGDTVLLTDKEHSSNLIPWLRLRGKGIVKVDYVGSRKDGSFDIEEMEDKLESGRVRLVSMAFTSNLTGYTIPAKEIIKAAHDHGAKVLLDAAQTVPHATVDVQDLDVDFLAFSIHKMCGPRGVGVLYGKKELLGHETGRDDGTLVLEPTVLGGGTIRDATYDSFSLLDPPERFEVGIQNFSGQIATGTAIEYLQRVGMNRIGAHVAELNSFLTDELLHRYGQKSWFRILGPREAASRGGILTMAIKRPNAMGIAEELNERSNLMIRDGALCVNSYLNKLFGEGWNGPGLPTEHRTVCRVSPYLYNTIEECQTFLDTLGKVFEERSYL
jgi:cysteine desulfurase/selenocysteine lyase